MHITRRTRWLLGALLALSLACATGCTSCVTTTELPKPPPDLPPAAPVTTPSPRPVPWPGVARGVAWDADWEDRSNWYGTPAAERGLDTLASIHIDWIAVTPFAFQKDIRKPELRFRPDWNAGLAKDIQNAHARGQKVMIKPHIWSNQFWDGSGAWRGHIRMDDDAAWQAWFDNYTRWIVHEATIAQRLKADAFCIGLEYLESTRAHADRWRAVIRAVREVYSGPLTYAAHTSELDLPFWDDLDVIGVNAYHPIADATAPTVTAMTDRWRAIGDELGRLSKRWDRPVVFAEVGYASIDGAAAAPFRWPTDRDQQDLQEQADCYSALFNVAHTWDWFGGMFIWKYKIGVERNNAAERHYVFQDKPAQSVIQAGFAKPFAREPAPSP